jgi:hypothetical protein
MLAGSGRIASTSRLLASPCRAAHLLAARRTLQADVAVAFPLQLLGDLGFVKNFSTGHLAILS